MKVFSKELIRQSSLYGFYRKYLLPLKVKYITPRLLSVHIEPTNGCNLKCALCYSQNPQLFKQRKRGFMDMGLFTKIIDEIISADLVKEIGLNYGGESLLHPRFVDMLEYASKRKLKIGFTQMGPFFTPR
jgi:MoaA/NifB/PqqE/SkfB family radical SAM enzyme